MSSASTTAADPGFHPEASDHIEPYVWKIAGVVILGMIMSILDTTIVNVALHTLGHDLHSSISQIQWVVTGYLLAVAGSLTSLVLFRVLQGFGGGMIMPIAQLIMAQVAGPKRMGRVMGVVVMPAMMGPILGPVIGGAILQYFHWSWIFLVNVPIGVVAFALAWRMLPHTDSGHAGRLDALGLVLMSGASSALVYGLSELGTEGTSLGAPQVVWPIVAGVVLGVVFCLHALRVE